MATALNLLHLASHLLALCREVVHLALHLFAECVEFAACKACSLLLGLRFANNAHGIFNRAICLTKNLFGVLFGLTNDCRAFLFEGGKTGSILALHLLHTLVGNAYAFTLLFPIVAVASHLAELPFEAYNLGTRLFGGALNNRFGKAYLSGNLYGK